MFFTRPIHRHGASSWRANWPLTVFAISLAFAGAGCDEAEDLPRSADVRSDDPDRVIHASELRGDDAEHGSVQPHAGKFVPRQITVYDEDELDRGDPETLQVRAPRGKDAWVLAGARALLDRTGKSDDFGAVLQAQRLMADIAAADAVLVVSAAEVSPRLETGGIVPMHDVVFTQVRTIHGPATPARWTMRIADEQSCGPPLPERGTEWLAFVRVRGDYVTLTFENPLRPITDGIIVDSGPLSIRPAALAAAVAAAQKEVSP